MRFVDKYVIWLTLCLALILRIINLNQSLWLDEAINVLAARDLSFWQFVTSYPIGDFHPPGYFALLWIWGHLFGFSEIAVRMPSVFLGVATVWIVYLIGTEFFNKKIGILAAFLLAINPLHVYYSQEARMYALAAFCGSLVVYLLLKYLDEPKKYFWPFIFSVGLLLYSDYLVYLLIPSLLIFVFWTERKKIISTFIATFAGGLFLLPWLAVFPQQLLSGRQTAENVPGWQKVVGGSKAKDFFLVYIKSIIGRVSVDNKIIYGGLLTFLGAFYGLLSFIGLKKLEKESKLLICWVFLPTFLAFAFSFFIPVLAYFRMLFIVPGLCLLLAKALSKLKKKYFIPVFGILILISGVCLGAYYFNSKFQRENWKELVRYLDKVDAKKSLVVFENNDLPAPYRYYAKKAISVVGGLAHFPASNLEDISDLNALTIDKTKIFLVDYLVEISDPNRLVDQKLKTLGWKVDHISDIPSLGLIYEYSKNP